MSLRRIKIGYETEGKLNEMKKTIHRVSEKNKKWIRN